MMDLTLVRDPYDLREELEKLGFVFESTQMQIADIRVTVLDWFMPEKEKPEESKCISSE